MTYSYYTLPRFERSYSMDKGISDSSTGFKMLNVSKNLLENYRTARNRSGRADSVVIGNFNRALSASPGNFSSKEHIPMHSTYSQRRIRRRSFSNDNEILPTSNLRAHTPQRYTYVFDPYENNLRGSHLYLDDSVNLLPRNYDLHYSYYYPQIYSSLNSRNAYLNSNLYYPKYRSIYSLSRVPESQYYYRYNILPHYGYDANDMIRQRRRKINSQIGYYSDFHAPPFRFFSGMKKSLNNIHDKMESHRVLLDRYTGIDMAPNSSSVGDNILEKSLQMTYRKRY